MNSARGKHSPQELVVVAAASRWEGVRLADRHLAEHLSRLTPVLFVEPPISRRGAVRQGAHRTTHPTLQRVGEQCWVLPSVALPAKDRLLVERGTSWLVRRAIGRAVAELGLPVAAMICSAPHRDLFASAGEQRKVYWVKDDYVAGAHLLDLPERRLRRAVASRAEEADEIVVVSPGLQSSFANAGHRAHLVPNGADVERFRHCSELPEPQDIDLPHPIVGYIGGVSDRIDPELLVGVAQRGWSLLLVGPRNRSAPWEILSPILDRANVRWVGPRPFEALPAYLGAIDVGIVPYRNDAFNRASFPLKALEYLAAGRGVVTSDLPAMRWLDSEHVRIAGSPESFADTVALALQDAESPATAEACQSLAAEHGWVGRARQFATIIGVRDQDQSDSSSASSP